MHPNQISEWTQHLQGSAIGVFRGLTHAKKTVAPDLKVLHPETEQLTLEHEC